MDDLIRGADGALRCWWCGTDPLYLDYHDREWGRPVHDDHDLFERICLEGFQSGLSWLTILRKREGFRRAFAAFDPVAVAEFTPEDVNRLMGDAEIVRNRRKIEATVTNARAVSALHERDGAGALGALIWSYRPADRPRPSSSAQIPAVAPESKALTAALKREGFVFVGPTTVYALMQACGLVDDHISGCAALV